MQQIVERAQGVSGEKKMYSLAIFVLLIVFLYNDILVPIEMKILEKPAGDASAMSLTESALPTIYTKQPENIYKGVLQSKKGDVYRVTLEARGGNNPQLEVFVHSSIFYETAKVGEIEIESIDNNEHKEIVFSTPGSFDSILIRLKEGEKDETKWDNRFAFIDSLSVARLDIDQGGIASLSPTVTGVQGVSSARLEDMGMDMLYTFSIRGDVTDYQSIFEATNSMIFDSKKKSVAAAKRNGEYFMYKLDMVYPIKRLVIRATQKGSDENEIHLQYSFDKSLWQSIEYSQKHSGSQKFFLSLNREVPREKTVYIKAFYEGEDKKSGTFALEELEVNALVTDYERKL